VKIGSKNVTGRRKNSKQISSKNDNKSKQAEIDKPKQKKINDPMTEEIEISDTYFNCSLNITSYYKCFLISSFSLFSWTYDLDIFMSSTFLYFEMPTVFIHITSYSAFVFFDANKSKRSKGQGSRIQIESKERGDQAFQK
jgi:hypothetical protein